MFKIGKQSAGNDILNIGSSIEIGRAEIRKEYDAENEDMVICNLCGKTISADNFADHCDLHG